MEELIKKAIEGKYTGFLQDRPQWEKDIHFQLITLDPLFWQALGKACGWFDTKVLEQKEKELKDCKDAQSKSQSDIFYWSWQGDIDRLEKEIRELKTKKTHIYYALRFHEINLTEGWDKAVEYLSALTKTK